MNLSSWTERNRNENTCQKLFHSSKWSNLANNIFTIKYIILFELDSKKYFIGWFQVCELKLYNVLHILIIHSLIYKNKRILFIEQCIIIKSDTFIDHLFCINIIFYLKD